MAKRQADNDTTDSTFSKHDCSTTWTTVFTISFSRHILFNFAMSWIVNDIPLQETSCIARSRKIQLNQDIIWWHLGGSQHCNILFLVCIFSMDNEGKKTSRLNSVITWPDIWQTEERSFSRPWMLITNLWRYHLTATRSLTLPVPRLCLSENKLIGTRGQLLLTPKHVNEVHHFWLYKENVRYRSKVWGH